jgi:hypothetical protein
LAIREVGSGDQSGREISDRQSNEKSMKITLIGEMQETLLVLKLFMPFSLISLHTESIPP